MDKKELIRYIYCSKIMEKWHCFSYHFSFITVPYELKHPFAKSLVDALLNINKKIPDYAISMIDRIASYSEKEKFQKQYEQLLQICAEIYVLNQAVNYFKDIPVTIHNEPTLGKSKMNPEFVLEYSDYKVGIEVKQPSLINHKKQRKKGTIEIPIKNEKTFSFAEQNYSKENIIKPHFNSVKDFLISANKKFKEFKNEDNFYSILFIIWDDFIYEPISALLSKPSGLFLENSFATENNKRITFKNVDAVFIDRQLKYFYHATRDESLGDNKKHAFDYGYERTFPFKVIINCPDSSVEIPDEIKKCYQVLPPSPFMGAEYIPSEVIIWS